MGTKFLCLYYDKSLVRTDHDSFVNIQCGRDVLATHLAMTGDNTGDNISSRNKFWSEITGLYWAWRHIAPADYVGLSSYRRFFNFDFHAKKPIWLTTTSQAQELVDSSIKNYDESIFSHADIITPVPYTYAYSIKKVWNMNYNPDDLNVLERVLRDRHPEYYSAFREHIYDNNEMIGHNMFVTSWENFRAFCVWVFDVLFQVEKEVVPDNYPSHQIRVFGYMHELLLEIFIKKHHLKTKRSQIIWVNDDTKATHFNSPIYKNAANLYYSITRLGVGDTRSGQKCKNRASDSSCH